MIFVEKVTAYPRILKEYSLCFPLQVSVFTALRYDVVCALDHPLLTLPCPWGLEVMGCSRSWWMCFFPKSIHFQT